MLTNYQYTAQYTARYILPSLACGFMPKHYYKIIIHDGNENEGYVVTSDYDYTDEKEVNLRIRLSNMKSIERYFEID